MKKLVILGTALLALNAMASEFQIKGGYDFTRNYKNGNGRLQDIDLKKGPTAGLEYIFDNQGEFEWGLGAEYKFSNDSGKLKVKKDASGFTAGDKYAKNAPVYALGKFNVITTKSGNDALYVLGRAGYGFASESKELSNAGLDVSGGLYGAAGIGTEFGPVSLEALYERQNLKVKGVSAVTGNQFKDRDKVDTFGVRLGYRIGNLVNNRQPKIVEKIVTVPGPEVVKEVIVEKPVQPTINDVPVTPTATLPFSCAANERKCVIRGFKVDGRIPSENEQSDLRAISNVINAFAQNGTIDFVGHTDSTGSAAYNQKLSVARAQNVARLLREYGLNNNIGYGTITGMGETQPMDTNATEQGRYNNRRVELFFQNVNFDNVRFITQ